MPLGFDFSSLEEIVEVVLRVLVNLMIGIPIATAVWLLLFIFIAWFFKTPALKYMNASWEPNRKKYTVEPGRGAILEFVRQPLYATTVWYPVIEFLMSPLTRKKKDGGQKSSGSRISRVLGGSLLAAIGVYVVLSFASGLFLSGTQLGRSLANVIQTLSTAFQWLRANWVVLAVSSYVGSAFMPAFVKWRWEWWWRHRKLIVRTDRRHFVEARPVWIALVPFVKGSDPRISSEETHLIKEVRMAPDVEDIGGRITPRLRDLVVKIYGGRHGSSSIAFYTEAQPTEPDIFPDIPDAVGVVQCLNQITQKARDRKTEYDLFTKEAIKIRGGFGQDDWDLKSAQRAEAKNWERFDELHPEHGKPFYIFGAEDPDLWNPETRGPTGKRLQLVDFRPALC